MKKLLTLLSLLLLCGLANAQFTGTGSGTATDPYLISTASDLASVATTTNAGTNYTGKTFVLNQNIDLSAYPNWIPIGTNSNQFKGTFDGKGHTISGLMINATTDYQGLFGYAGSGSKIMNLGIIDCNITSTRNNVGGLAGYVFGGTIANSYSTGILTVTGTESMTGNYVGGLVGNAYSGAIANSYSIGSVIVSGTASMAGSGVGGLVGYAYSGAIANSYSIGSVIVSGTASMAGSDVGGLVGYVNSGAISNSYSTGSVTVSGAGFGTGCSVGGLVGNALSGAISNSYSTGSVTVSASGFASGKSVGGLVGYLSDVASTTNSFWDTQTSGMGTSAGGIGKTTSEMKTLKTFTDAGWDFSTVWGYNAGKNNMYPYLLEKTVFNAILTTTAVSTLSINSATLGGNITDNGGFPVTERGIVYSSTNTSPIIGGPEVTKVTNGTGSGSFSASIGSLTANTAYYVQAYAITSLGISYGGAVTFATLAPAPTTISVVVSTPGALSAAITAAGGDLTTVTNLTVTGYINDLDFKAMRDNMPKLAVLDISRATVVTYKGTDGTGNTGTEITYPDNEIPQFAFNNPATNTGKISLTTVTFPENITSIGESSFTGCTGLKDELILPSTLLEIGSDAFSGCTKLSGNLNIPDKVKTIGHGAFGECTGFSGNLNLPTSLLEIGEAAFLRCSGFTGTLRLPINLKTLVGGAFMGCSGFNGLVLSPQLTSIEEVTFYECTGLSGTLIIPSSVVNINEQSFQSCEKLSSIVFEPNSSLKTIRGYAFAYCTGLKGVLVIPNSGVTLLTAAFTRCTGLTSVTIPSNISKIDEGIFAECSGLTSIFALPVIPVDLSSSDLVFYGVDKTTCKLYVPAGSKALYEKANQWEDFYGNIVEGAVAPTVTTLPIVITCSSIAKGGGSIISLGDVNPTQHGVVWSTSHNPDISLTTKTSQGEINTVGDFKSDITGLVPETMYYIRAYATNNAGTSYGDELTFKTPKMSPIITSFTPASGIIGSLVTITGLDFSTILADNEVYVGSLKATLTACTATSITFTIPTGAVNGTIKVVLKNGEQALSATNLVILGSPTFTSTPVTTVGYGQTYNYNIAATTEGNLATTITAPTRPAWMTFSPGSGQSTASLIGNISSGVQICGVASDNNGNIFTITKDGTTIYKILPDGTTSVWRSGLLPGVVWELHIYDEYIYIPKASDPSNSVTRIPLSDPMAEEVTMASVSGGIMSLANNGNYIFAADFANNIIYKIDKSTKDKQVLLNSSNGLVGPNGLVSDAAGNLYIANYIVGRILKFDGTTVTTLLTGLAKPNSMRIDKDGNFYISFDNGGIRKYKPDFSSYVVVSNSATDDVEALSYNANSSLVYSIFNSNQIYRLQTGASIQGTPAKSDVGPHNVVLRATNSAGYTEQTFTVNVIDNVAPVVSTFSPVINATNIALQPALSLTFDEEVSLGTIGIFSIYNGASLVKSYDLSVAADKALFTLSPDKKTVSVTLPENLPVNTVVSVGLGAGFVKDKYDNGFAGFTAASNTWKFTTINKVTQVINFPAITAKTYGNAAFTLGDATTDKGLTVTYTAADPSVVSIVGNQATILRAGNTKITATQTGDNVTFAATAVERTLDVNKAALTIVADNKSKVYDGLAFSNFSVTYTGFVKNETAAALMGTLAFEGTAIAAINFGTNYVVTPKGYTSTNYNITFEDGKLDITKRPITITVDAKSKVYGDADPILTAQVSAGMIITGDVASGNLKRAVGETVNDYAISKDSYTFGSNYNETFVPANLTITKRPITITVDAKSKVYGDADPILTAQVSAGMIITGDVASGNLKRAVGETVNDYAISKDSYTFGSNYNETFVPANLTITKRPITITADAKLKVYGDADPTLTAQVTTGTIVTGDVATGSLTRALGETVADYAINKGFYTYGSNYEETYVSKNLTITKRPITITADAKSKVYGNVDPAFTALVTNGTIVTDDVASGSLTRASGETVADYAINKGFYTYGSNYEETYVSKNLTITKRPITITADAKAKVYGNVDPAFTALVTNGTIVTDDVASGSLTRAIGETVADYTINQGSYTYGLNYNETYIPAKLTIGKLAINVSAVADYKTYDGTNSSSVTPTYDALVNGDMVTAAPTQVFDNAKVSTTHVLTPSGLTIKNGTTDATGNYIISYISTGASGTITAKQLSITNPTISTVKTYDGNSTASVVPGTLSGVIANEAANVLLGATASYQDAKAETAKTITVKYSLSGSAAVNYTAPADYSLATGEISRKQLTISDPTVVSNKMVDGNSTAAITTVGSLSGLETVDANNVTVVAAANYNDAIVGTGKTITVSYSLNGNAKDNYIAPVNYNITNAKISAMITLSSLATPTPGCEGDYLDLDYSILTGTPTQYKITFDAATITAGIQNVGYTNLPVTTTSGTLQIPIPKGTVDGTYSGTLMVRNEFGLESPAYSFTFTIQLSADYMVTKFNQIILCDNKNNRFTAYQWYKNGEAIKDATKQFYNDPAGLIGAYAVQVTDANGLKIMSCEKTLNFAKAVKVSTYPNPVKSTQTCTVQVSGLSDKELETAELSVYTLQGTCIYQSPKVEMFNYLKLPVVDGVYVGHVKTADGNEFLFKVIAIK